MEKNENPRQEDEKPPTEEPDAKAPAQDRLLVWGARRLAAGGGHVFRFSRTAAIRALKSFAYGTLGGGVILLFGLVHHLNGRPDLDIWHQVKLEQEFEEGSREVTYFAGYLQLEDDLFAELDAKVYDQVGEGTTDAVNRYRRGSRAEPGRDGTNWNRTFELPANSPTAGVLLLHGMSDSPYSMRELGASLNRQGAHVVGLRLPGHGTAPSGLVRAKWEDMAAATQLALVYLREQVKDGPLFVVGYSNGGALAIHYALDSLLDDGLPSLDGIVLISPAIGVSAVASLAVWQGRLGDWLGMDKLAWNSIQPEYDPYKYGSFAVNAGYQVYRLTTEIQQRLAHPATREQLDRFPPILAFQSVVDATVSAPTLIQGLFQKLPEAGHELVLFDINRMAGIDSLMVSDPTSKIASILQAPDRPFAVSLITNQGAHTPEVECRRWQANDPKMAKDRLDLSWPEDVYSLSHISLPFAVSDPLYGTGEESAGQGGYNLGNVALRGERGVLRISPADQLRLRWNPFYPYLEERALRFIQEPPQTSR